MNKALIIFIFFPLLIIGQNWQQAANFIGNGRHHPITFSNDNYGFVVSGSYMNDVFKYDKCNNSWTQLQDIPFTGRGYGYGLANSDKAYVGFGSTDNGSYPTDWWEYDMNNDSWTQKASFPGDGRNHPAMILVGNKIFVGCGSNANQLRDWWEYNISTDSWTQRPDLPANERHHPFYFGIGDYAYVGFGHGSFPGPGSNPSSFSAIYNDFFQYNSNNNTWTQMSNFPGEARVAGTQFSYNNKGYILSGDGDDHNPLNSGEFWEYDPLTDLWNQLDDHPGDAIWAPGCFFIEPNIYFLLGQNNNSSFPTTPLAVYTYKLNDNGGCTDPTAYNYSSSSLFDDCTCCYISGCMDPSAINYDSLACYDDGNCIDANLGCLNPNASNYDPLANIDVFNGGANDINIGSGSFFYNNQHLIFNSNEECIIKSADIYAENTNTITFELRNNNGIVIDDTTQTVNPGKQNIILNFSVPASPNLQLGISANNSGLYRNSTGANYPYNIGNMISITGSSATQTEYYYFYYNIEIEAKCIEISADINQINPFDKRLIKKIDILGKETQEKINQPIFYIYEDGTVEKKIIIK